MSDLPNFQALQQHNAKNISGEHLEVLGKQAAAMWGDGRVRSLNDAVVSTVKHAGLSPEQVKRVVEFTNSEAYLTDFRKQGSGHRVVEFEGGPASSAAVLQDLNDGGGGSVFDPGNGDYHSPPRTKTASDDRLEADFMRMFAAEDPTLPEHNPLSNTMGLRDKLATATELATAQISTMENMFDDLRRELFHHVKQAALSGHNLGEIAAIWAEAAPSEEHVKVAFQAIFPELVSNGVFATTADMVDSLEKGASVQAPVNGQHPLVTNFVDFCDVLSKLAQVREVQHETQTGLAQLTEFLTKEGKGEGLLHHAGKALTGASNIAGKGGKVVGEALLGKGKGEGVGNAARLGVKYVLPAVGAHEAYRRTLKHNQGFQAAKQTALSTIPGTSEYNNKELELQMEGQGYAPGMGY